MTNKIPEGKVAVVCNDSGGAEQVSSWLLNNCKKIPYVLSLNGPAKDIFKKKIGRYKNYYYKNAINQSNWVLTGTSCSNQLEINAIKYSLSINKNVVSIIDHWVNYTNRFLDGAQTYLPNEIWVTDKIAFKKVATAFFKQKIKLITNYYLRDTLEEINRIEKDLLIKNSNILFLCDPSLPDWGRREQGDLQAMRYFFENMWKIGITKDTKIIFRIHPSDSEIKYDSFLQRNYSNFEVVHPRNETISKQIAESDIVVGCQTYALVIAAEAKKRVFSVLPPWAPACPLPDKNLKHLKDLI